MSAALMNEPLIKEMLIKMSEYKISVDAHGIMEFPSAEKMVEAVNFLQYYSDLFEEQDYDESYPCDPVLCAFEYAYDFYSLRKSIEDEISYLEKYESLFDHNDPDNHYVVSPYMRAILNPNSTVVFEELITVLYDNFCVG